jgi:hypothetical protein
MKNRTRSLVLVGIAIAPAVALSQAQLFTAEYEQRGAGQMFDLTSLFAERDLEF